MRGAQIVTRVTWTISADHFFASGPLAGLLLVLLCRLTDPPTVPIFQGVTRRHCHSMLRLWQDCCVHVHPLMFRKILIINEHPSKLAAELPPLPPRLWLGRRRRRRAGGAPPRWQWRRGALPARPRRRWRNCENTGGGSGGLLLLTSAGAGPTITTAAAAATASSYSPAPAAAQPPPLQRRRRRAPLARRRRRRPNHYRGGGGGGGGLLLLTGAGDG